MRMPSPEISVAVGPVTALGPHRGAWADLAERAIEPNPFYAPHAVFAAHAHLPGFAGLKVVAAYRAGRLVGLAPIMRPGLLAGPLPGAASLYWNPFVTSTMPLLDADGASAIWAAMLAGLHQAGIRTLLAPQVPMTHGGADALTAAMEAQRIVWGETARWERPAIESRLSSDDYLHRHPPRRRKAMTQRRAKLDGAGEVRVTHVAGGPEATVALAQFLALEAGGWKGRAGTALASRPQTRAYIEALVAEAGAGAQFERLALDGEVIAVNLNLVSQGACFAFKSAYDERFARFAPGILLDGETLRHALTGLYARVDSCAGPDHRLMGEWLERETIATLVTATAPDVPGWRVTAVAAWITLVAAARARVKKLIQRNSANG